MQYPRVEWQSDRIRVIATAAGHVVEVAVGSDAMGVPTWRRLQAPEAEPPAEGWKDLCDAIGLDPAQWRRLYEASLRSVDPAPIGYDPWGTPKADRAALRQWRDRNTLPARVHNAVRRHRRSRKSVA